MVAAEAFLFVIALAFGCWNFILRRMYKHRSEMFEAEVKRMKTENWKIICGNSSVFQPQRQN